MKKHLSSIALAVAFYAMFALLGCSGMTPSTLNQEVQTAASDIAQHSANVQVGLTQTPASQADGWIAWAQYLLEAAEIVAVIPK